MFSHDQYEALRHGTGLLDRRSRGRLQLTGADRRSYLHGLLTNDVAALLPGTGCYAALLTPQGRMLSDMRVSELGDRILVDLPGVTADGIRQRLADFIFTEEVEIRDAGGELGHFGVYGPGAADVVAAVLASAGPDLSAVALAKAEGPALQIPDVASGFSRKAAIGAELPPEGGSHDFDTRLQAMAPDANREFTFGEGTVVVIRSDDYGVPGFETFVPASEADRWTDALRAAGATDVEAAAAEVTRVEAGRPEFGPDMDDHTIPLEAGIEARAISLTKGCYVGQEVIIRVLHRGQGRVARRLVGLVAAAGDPPLGRGMRLEADGKPIGSITSAVLSPSLGRPIALGYVHRDFAEPGRIIQVTQSDGSSVAGRSVTVAITPFVAPASR
jgi:folate-binding protein YgfZ